MITFTCKEKDVLPGSGKAVLRSCREETRVRQNSVPGEAAST